MKTVKDVVDILENLSPVKYACDWDNVGLHVGRMSNPVSKILVTLDIDYAAVMKALDEDCDMIVSHHPLIFKGISKLNSQDPVANRVLTLAENDISAYCMHTNFDCVGGMGSLAADRLGLVETEVVSEVLDGEGIGRVGNLSTTERITVKELCELVKDKFELDAVTLFGDESAYVSRVAVVPGSGKDEIALARQKGAQAIVTGDVSYHYGIDSSAEGINVIDAGHYGIEHIFIDFMADFLKNSLDEVEVVAMPLNNPQKII